MSRCSGPESNPRGGSRVAGDAGSSDLPQVAEAFQLRGRQIGPLTTAAGILAPTGTDLAIRVIDILTINDGLISEIHMVADELGALAAIETAALVQSDAGGG